MFVLDPSNTPPLLHIQPGTTGAPIDLEQTRCLWVAGQIGNRAALARQYDLPAMLADADLLAGIYLHCDTATAAALTGSAAWIVWDSRRQALVAARDRIGIQSIYYIARNGVLWIAGQLEVLLPILAAPLRPNPRAVVNYLHGRPPLPGESFYSDIHELPPGHLLTAQSGRLAVAPYWQLTPQPLLRLHDDTAYASAYCEIMTRVMREYVPTERAAVTLSSGLDSTSVAAFLMRVAPDADISAITWAAPEIPEADESQYAAEAAACLGLPLYSVRADLAWTLRDAEGISTARTAPYALQYTELWRDALQLAAAQGMRTLFTGVCGDNLFGSNVFGYADLLLSGRWIDLVQQLRYHLPRSPVYRSWRRGLVGMVAIPMLRSYAPGLLRRRARPAAWLRPEHRALWRESLATPFHTWRMLPGRQERLRMLDDRWIPPTVGVNARLGADYGIEFVHPLLDHRLLEFAASLPVAQAIRYGQRKIIVRNALRDVLPASIVNRWQKIVPTKISMRGLYEREQAKVWGYLTDMRAAGLGYVDEAALQESYRQYLQGTGGDEFWYPLTLEDWLRRYF